MRTRHICTAFPGKNQAIRSQATVLRNLEDDITADLVFHATGHMCLLSVVHDTEADRLMLRVESIGVTRHGLFLVPHGPVLEG